LIVPPNAPPVEEQDPGMVPVISTGLIVFLDLDETIISTSDERPDHDLPVRVPFSLTAPFGMSINHHYDHFTFLSLRGSYVRFRPGVPLLLSLLSAAGSTLVLVSCNRFLLPEVAAFLSGRGIEISRCIKVPRGSIKSVAQLYNFNAGGSGIVVDNKGLAIWDVGPQQPLVFIEQCEDFYMHLSPPSQLFWWTAPLPPIRAALLAYLGPLVDMIMMYLDREVPPPAHPASGLLLPPYWIQNRYGVDEVDLCLCGTCHMVELFLMDGMNWVCGGCGRSDVQEENEDSHSDEEERAKRRKRGACFLMI